MKRLRLREEPEEDPMAGSEGARAGSQRAWLSSQHRLWYLCFFAVCRWWSGQARMRAMPSGEGRKQGVGSGVPLCAELCPRVLSRCPAVSPEEQASLLPAGVGLACPLPELWGGNTGPRQLRGQAALHLPRPFVAVLTDLSDLDLLPVVVRPECPFLSFLICRLGRPMVPCP